MTSLNAFDRQCQADILRREGAAAVLSELAWLLAETDMAKFWNGRRTRRQTMT